MRACFQTTAECFSLAPACPCGQNWRVLEPSFWNVAGSTGGLRGFTYLLFCCNTEIWPGPGFRCLPAVESDGGALSRYLYLSDRDI